MPLLNATPERLSFPGSYRPAPVQWVRVWAYIDLLYICQSQSGVYLTGNDASCSVYDLRVRPRHDFVLHVTFTRNKTRPVID